MRKKIVLLNSSKRKRSTLKLLRDISLVLQDHDTEIIGLGEYEIQACNGCEACITRGACPIDDDAKWILERIASADGVVIGTPVYLRQISGLLKLLVDRSCSWYHRSPIVGKPVFFVTTTAATGTRQTIRYLKDLALQWGAVHCGSLSRTVMNIDRKPVSPNKLEKFRSYLDAKTLQQHRPSLRELIEFNTQKVLAMKIIPLDKQYWEERGYSDSPYFYQCRIGPLKRLVAALYYRILRRVIPDRIGEEGISKDPAE